MAFHLPRVTSDCAGRVRLPHSCVCGRPIFRTRGSVSTSRVIRVRKSNLDASNVSNLGAIYSATASCVALDFRSGLSSTSSIHGLVPPASDRQGWRECKRIAGAILAMQSCRRGICAFMHIRWRECERIVGTPPRMTHLVSREWTNQASARHEYLSCRRKPVSIKELIEIE